MGRVVNVFIGAVVAALIISAASLNYMWPRWKVSETMAVDGFTNIQLSHAFINRAPWACGGEDVDLFTYTAVQNNRQVSGFACYRGWMWGVAYWND